MTDFENAQDFAIYGMAYRLAHPPKKPRKCKYDIDEIQRLREHGLTVKEIAEKLGAKPHAISNFLHRKKATSTEVVKKYDYEEVKKLREAGATFEEIAELYGTTPKAVKSYCWRKHIAKGE